MKVKHAEDKVNKEYKKFLSAVENVDSMNFMVKLVDDVIERNNDCLKGRFSNVSDLLWKSLTISLKGRKTETKSRWN